MKIKRNLTIAVVTALLAVPAFSSLNVSHASVVPQTSIDGLVAWNAKNGNAENSSDHQPSVGYPKDVYVTKGTPSNKYGSSFQFRVAGSNKTYTASWRSPLNQQLLEDENKGNHTVPTNRVANNYQNNPTVNHQNVASNNSVNTNHNSNAKLAQTGEKDTSIMASVVAGLTGLVLLGASKIKKLNL